jgi:hydrogenase/urease accessory protein HupE
VETAKSIPLRAVWVTITLLLALAGAAWAHDPGLSSATVRLFPDKLEALLVFSTVDAAELVDFDTNRDGEVSAEELAAAEAELTGLASGAFEATFNDYLASPSEARVEFDTNNNTTVSLLIEGRPFTNLVMRSKWLAYLPPGHRQFFVLQNPNGVVLAERMLSANSDSVTIQLDPEEGDEPLPIKSHSFRDFLILGIEHIVLGYDHLLFLFGLLIVTRNFISSLKIITCFTIAHSITLALATLDLVQIPSNIVEPLIAASIVYVGVENILRENPKGRWLLTFAFGLIHGFGFATVLRELGVGASGSGIAVPLLSFNLGVELGQIAIAAIVLPIIWKLRSRPVFVGRWVPAFSVLVALLGGFWFVQRVWF